MRYRWQEVFSLGRWSSLLPPGFLVSRGTQAIRREGTLLFAYGAITLSGMPFQDTSAKQVLCNFPLLLWKQDDGCLQPPLSNGHSLLHPVGLGSSPFARRYLGNRFCFLFLGLLRCFSSPGPPRPLKGGDAGFPASGFPIRRPPDHRLLAPPRSVSPPAASFIGFLPQGILRMPLLT